MPGIGRHRDNYYQAVRGSDVFTRVRARLTANTPATVWDPGSGLKFVLKGFALTISCTTTCDGSEVAGNMLCLLDNAANTPIITLATLPAVDIGAGSHWPGSVYLNTMTMTINTAYTEFQNYITANLREGYKSATAGNVLKFGLVDGASTPASVNVSAGVFILNGLVWGAVSST